MDQQLRAPFAVLVENSVDNAEGLNTSKSLKTTTF